MTASSTTTVDIERMAVHWRAHGFSGVGRPGDDDPDGRLVDPARLDRLVEALLAGPLEDALAATAADRDQVVCLRSVTVPPTTMRWDRPDADVVGTWARAIAEAVAGSVDGPAAGIVRYRSVDHAVIDLVTRVLGGDPGRAWAWRQMGLWPADLPVDAVPTAEAMAVAADVLADRPLQVVPAVAVLVREGRLSDAPAQWGTDRVVALVAAAWAAHGGDRRVVTGDLVAGRSHSPAMATMVGRLARSAVGRAAGALIRQSPAAGGPVDPTSGRSRGRKVGRSRARRPSAGALAGVGGGGRPRW